MKKLILILIAISLVLISCDIGEKKRQATAKAIEKSMQDSIKREKERIRLAFEDSTAIFAWGDAIFGMTKKEVLQTKSFSGGNQSGNTIWMHYEKEFALEQAIGLKKKLSINANFGGKSKNELAYVYLHCYYDWNEFDDLIFDVDCLIKEFTKKYRKPDDINEDYLDLRTKDVDELKYMLIAMWMLGSGHGSNGMKYITINLNKATSGMYEYKVSIYNSAIPEKDNQQSTTEIKAERERVQMRKDAVDNSF